jgi:hypothetical protein
MSSVSYYFKKTNVWNSEFFTKFSRFQDQIYQENEFYFGNDYSNLKDYYSLQEKNRINLSYLIYKKKKLLLDIC